MSLFDIFFKLYGINLCYLGLFVVYFYFLFDSALLFILLHQIIESFILYLLTQLLCDLTFFLFLILCLFYITLLFLIFNFNLHYLLYFFLWFFWTDPVCLYLCRIFDTFQHSFFFDFLFFILHPTFVLFFFFLHFYLICLLHLLNFLTISFILCLFRFYLYLLSLFSFDNLLFILFWILYLKLFRLCFWLMFRLFEVVEAFTFVDGYKLFGLSLWMNFNFISFLHLSYL